MTASGEYNLLALFEVFVSHDNMKSGVSVAACILCKYLMKIAVKFVGWVRCYMKEFFGRTFWIGLTTLVDVRFLENTTAQKIKFSKMGFFRKCEQIRRKLRIWSHLLKKSLMKNFIFCECTFSKSTYNKWVHLMHRLQYSDIKIRLNWKIGVAVP